MDYRRQGEETEPGEAIPDPTADPRTKREAHGPRPGKPNPPHYAHPPKPTYPTKSRTWRKLKRKVKEQR